VAVQDRHGVGLAVLGTTELAAIRQSNGAVPRTTKVQILSPDPIRGVPVEDLKCDIMKNGCGSMMVPAKQKKTLPDYLPVDNSSAQGWHGIFVVICVIGHVGRRIRYWPVPITA
jgi:hypothetical protein